MSSRCPGRARLTRRACFDGSDQKLVAAQFLDSWEEGDAEAFEALKKNPTFQFLNQQVVPRVVTRRSSRR